MAASESTSSKPNKLDLLLLAGKVFNDINDKLVEIVSPHCMHLKHLSVSSVLSKLIGNFVEVSRLENQEVAFASAASCFPIQEERPVVRPIFFEGSGAALEW